MISVNKKVLPILISAALLGACKDSSNNSSSSGHQTDHFDINETGRLVVTSSENAELGVFNSQDGHLIDRFMLDYSASGLYTSPQSRFALIAQRDHSQVQILDGGLYQEDHGDHLHPYETAPNITTQTLEGVRPTHYRENESRSAFFYDGDADNSLLASVIDFNDDEILNNNIRSLELSTAMHGVAEPRGDFLLATYRASTATSVLPDQVELFKFNSNSGNYDAIKRFEERCPSLHGAFSTEDASVFGCSDGVLVIRQNGEAFSAEKIANPTAMADDSRIGSFSGHADSHIIAGWASGDLYALNLDNSSIELVDWTGGTAAEYSTAKMDDEGNILMVLNKTGGLHLLDAKDNFKHLIEIRVLTALPTLEGHSSVGIASSKSSDNVYITDAVNKKIVVVNLEHKELEEPINLPFTPKHIAWVGIPNEAEEHDGHNH